MATIRPVKSVHPRVHESVRPCVRASVAVATIGFVLACGEAPESGRSAASGAREEPRYGGTAVVGFLAEAQSMNELVAADDNSDELQSYVLLMTLIRYDTNLRPGPYLAEAWDTAAAGGDLALTFHLRKDVRWHDGVPTTAHDVKFTFDRMKDPAVAYPKASTFAFYDSAVVRDSFAITFYLKRHPGFLDAWRTVSPMPRHILGDVPAAALARHPYGTQNPVGNGPFRFVEHRPGDRWVFEANPEFPQALGGRPYLDRLVYRIIPEPMTLISEFIAGEVDVYIAVRPSQVRRLSSEPAARVVSYPSRSYAFIAWNGRHPLFRDPRVRRALTHALDRHEIVETARFGLGQVAKGPVPPWHRAHHRELDPLPFDPPRARELLSEAGWEDRDGDGLRERDGRRASFELRTHPDPVRQDIITLVADQLSKVGVEASPRVQEAQSLLSDITSPERRFDAVLIGWTSDFQLSQNRELFACDARERPFQFASYCNPRVDSLLNRLATAGNDPSELETWYDFQVMIQEDQPFTFIYYETLANAVRARVRNVEMDIRGTLLNSARWWLESSDPSTAVTREDR